MVNALLFVSSCVWGVFHGVWLFAFAPVRVDLTTVIVLGFATSIANHGTTSDVAKWCDRVAMAVCTCSDLWLASAMNVYHQLYCTCLVLLAVAFYFCAKWSKRTDVHALAHVAISVNHLLMIQFFST